MESPGAHHLKFASRRVALLPDVIANSGHGVDQAKDELVAQGFLGREDAQARRQGNEFRIDPEVRQRCREKIVRIFDRTIRVEEYEKLAVGGLGSTFLPWAMVWRVRPSWTRT